MSSSDKWTLNHDANQMKVSTNLPFLFIISLVLPLAPIDVSSTTTSIAIIRPSSSAAAFPSLP